MNVRSVLMAILIFVSINLCAQDQKESISNELLQRAKELAQTTLITDGHVDLPYRLKVRNFKLTREFLGIPIETSEGDFDYVRAKKGGLDAPFMSIYLPSSTPYSILSNRCR